MNLQTILDNASQASRIKTLETSPQITLGELLLKLEAIPESPDKVDRKVVFEFEGIFPTNFDSWRGIYREIALGFSTEYSEGITHSEFIEEVKQSIGKEFTGYKGGEFLMSKHTPVWVANYGTSYHNAIVDITFDEYEVKIITKVLES